MYFTVVDTPQQLTVCLFESNKSGMPLCCRHDNTVVGDVGMMSGIEKNSLLLQVLVAQSCIIVQGHGGQHFDCVGCWEDGHNGMCDATLTRGHRGMLEGITIAGCLIFKLFPGAQSGHKEMPTCPLDKPDCLCVPTSLCMSFCVTVLCHKYRSPPTETLRYDSLLGQG